MEKLILSQRQSPGDYLCCLAAVESLHIQYPGRFLTDLHCIYPALFDNHPNITRMNRNEGRHIQMQCPNIHKSHLQNVHFLATWCSFLGEQLQLPLELKVTHPTIYLSDEEKALPRRRGTWLINSSYKSDCEAKWWGHSRYQALVDAMPEIHFIQVGESFHNWQELKGPHVECMVGKTNGDCRALIRLASQVDGGVGGVTFVGHVMAALSKPYVCINTREPPWFTSYPTQTTLSSMGKLPCCKEKSCWASAVSPKGTGNKCQLPVLANGEWTPGCAELITVATVAEAIRSYKLVVGNEFDSRPSPRTYVRKDAVSLPALPPDMIHARNHLISDIHRQRVSAKSK